MGPGERGAHQEGGSIVSQAPPRDPMVHTPPPPPPPPPNPPLQIVSVGKHVKGYHYIMANLVRTPVSLSVYPVCLSVSRAISLRQAVYLSIYLP